MDYLANSDRYNKMVYRRCGNSGLKLPAISLGMWRNFGDTSSLMNGREMILGAFDLGINHFDLANNYGPCPGSAEETFGKIISGDLKAYRDELVISTKAGYYMRPGPYGDWGSRKYIISSLEHSLISMNLDYVDIFYHHRPDPDTPLEETAEALAQMVRQGKALYIGISNYSPEQTARMIGILDGMGVHLLIHQLSHSMLGRQNEPVYDVLDQNGVGSIAFSPLAQGILSNRYLHGIPEETRAKTRHGLCTESCITPEMMAKVEILHDMAHERGQGLSQMALAWVLQRATSVIIGASRLSQIRENCQSTENLEFSKEENDKIDAILNS
jgi:L-glyceraldehyde 3-phosphate reductase